MKVRMIRNAARGLGCELQEGETGDVSDSLGELLISKGLAAKITVAIPETIKAIPKKPKLAEAKEPEIKE